MEFYQTHSTDVLIAGGGLAAFQAAHECAKAGLSVTIAVEKGLCSGSSFYPLTSGLGCQAPASDEDKQWFLEELQESGAGMQDDRLTRIYIDEIGRCIEGLSELGIQYVTPQGRKACFAKRDRVLACWYGLPKQGERMEARLRQLPGITILEYCALELLLKEGDHISGAVLCDYRGRLIHITTNRVILATGGTAGLYQHSLNTDDVCGTGHAVALHAGAELVNMEFIQFIPGVLSPVYKLLFSEMTLRYCTAVLSPQGKDILSKYLPKEVSVRQCLDSRAGHGPFTCADESKYFDISMMSEIQKTGNQKGFRLVYSDELFQQDNFFVQEYLKLAKRNGVDLLHTPFMVAPFGHAANGGILIDEGARTTVPGLYAAGECAGGLHGADRHGGNASGACLVFGRRAAQSAILDHRKSPASCNHSPDRALEQYQELLDSGNPGCISAEETLSAVGKLLWENCSIVRSEAGLSNGLSRLQEMEESYNAAMLIRSGTDPMRAFKAAASLKTARAILLAAQGRKESRGAHYRSDYPLPDDIHFGKRQRLSYDGQNFHLATD